MKRFYPTYEDKVSILSCFLDNEELAYSLAKKYVSIHAYNNIAKVKKDGMFGFINRMGNVIIPIVYKKVIWLNDEFILARNSDGYYFINNSGNWISQKYKMAKPFSEGLAAVKINGKYGFIDKDEKLVIPCLYSYASIFSEGLCAVVFHKKLGFIDYKNEVVIPFQYDYDTRESYLFDDEYACVAKKREDNKLVYGYIDKDGFVTEDFKFNCNESIYSTGIFGEPEPIWSEEDLENAYQEAYNFDPEAVWNTD